MEKESTQQASFFRAAIVLGLLPTGAAIAWADGLIAASSGTLAPEIYDLALAPPTDSLAVIDALGRIAGALLGEGEPEDVIHGVLDLIRDDLFSGRRDLPEAIALVYRASYSFAVEENLRWEMVALEDDYALVVDRIAGDLPTMSGIARDWLGKFDGASAKFFPRAA